MGLALEWVSRILVVSAEMVLPGLLGKWLDDRWGVSFLGLLGFALGMSLGVFHLLAMTRRAGPPPPSDRMPPSHEKDPS